MLKHSLRAVLTLFLYSINRFLVKPYCNPESGIISGFLCNHANDYLGGFLFCAYLHILLILGGEKRIHLSSFFDYLFLGILCAIAWEGIAPIFLVYSTADWLDCIAYICGTISYYFIDVNLPSLWGMIKPDE